jgi:hypothetical protein
VSARRRDGGRRLWEVPRMKAEVITVSKHFRPLKIERVVPELKKSFPGYEYLPHGNGASAVVVKKSNFAGAMVDVSAKAIRIKASMPKPIAKALDAALLGTISAATSPDLVQQLKRFLKQKYAS